MKSLKVDMFNQIELDHLQITLILTYLANLPDQKLEYGHDGIIWTISVVDGKLKILTDKPTCGVLQRVTSYIGDRVLEQCKIDEVVVVTLKQLNIPDPSEKPGLQWSSESFTSAKALINI